jgi:hypothetical protein
MSLGYQDYLKRQSREMQEAIARVIDRGVFVLGEENRQLEAELKDYFGSVDAVTVGKRNGCDHSGPSGVWNRRRRLRGGSCQHRYGNRHWSIAGWSDDWDLRYRS